MKRIFVLALSLLFIGGFTADANTHYEDVIQIEMTYTDATAEPVLEGKLLAWQDEPAEASGVTAEDVADIVEEQVVPTIEALDPVIRYIPPKGSDFQTWLQWVMAHLVTAVFVIIGIWSSGGSGNRFKNLKTG